MEKKISKYSFWIIQFLGWGGLAVFSIIFSRISNNFIGHIIAFFLITLSGIIATSILRIYLKKYVSSDNFKAWDILKIFISTIIVCFFYGYITYGFGYVAGYLSTLFFDDVSTIFNTPPKLKFARFIGLSVLFGGWVVFYYGIKLLLKFNTERIESITIKDSIKKEQLNILRGQINPEFMISSLKNIRMLMLKDVGLSREILTKLSEILRYALTKNNIDQVTLAEETEAIDNFIDISRIESKTQFEFLKEIDSNILGAPIPPMLILTLVENAIKHSFDLEKEKKVILSIFKEKNLVKVEVTHASLENNKEIQLLLNKTKQRLRLLYNDLASITLNVEKRIITVCFPLVWSDYIKENAS